MLKWVTVMLLINIYQIITVLHTAMGSISFNSHNPMMYYCCLHFTDEETKATEIKVLPLHNLS